jgi:hypothetical protein
VLLVVLAHGPAAYGSPSPSSVGDPPAGSPSGGIYQLPLEKGRADAAPKDSGNAGSPAEAGAGEDEPSYYRSENNFGSSSEVPGAPSGGGSSPGGSDAPKAADATGSGGSSGSGGNDSNAAAAAGQKVAAVTDTGNTSPGANIALLVAIGLVAIGVGVVGARANRLRAR